MDLSTNFQEFWTWFALLNVKLQLLACSQIILNKSMKENINGSITKCGWNEIRLWLNWIINLLWQIMIIAKQKHKTEKMISYRWFSRKNKWWFELIANNFVIYWNAVFTRFKNQWTFIYSFGEISSEFTTWIWSWLLI